MAATGTKAADSGKGGGPKKDAMSAAEKKLTPVPPPNEKSHQEKIEAETKAIDELKVKINDLQKRINNAMGGRDEYNRKKGEMRVKLDRLSEKAQSLERERRDLVEKIESKQREGREMRANVQNLKKSIGYATEDEIDQKIKDIEASMMTTSMTLKEEKKMMQSIAQLKANRPLVGRYSSLEKSASTFEGSSIVPLKARLDQIRDELNDVRKERREEQDRFRDMVKERSTALGPVGDLIDERDELSKIMSEHFHKRRAAQEELNQEVARWTAYQKELRAIRSEKQREDRAKRALESERVALERQLEKVDDVPMEDDVALLEQTLNYVLKLQSDRDGTKEETKGEQEEKTSLAPEGEGMALLPKSQREEEFYFAPKAGKKGKKMTGKPKERERAKVLKHDLGTLSYFEVCGVSAPVTFDEIDHCLKQLQEKLSESRKLQKTVLDGAEERRRMIQEQLDALDGRAKSGMRQEGEGKSITAGGDDSGLN